MKRCNVPCCVALIVLGFISARASVFGDVKGAVVDPQQRPIAAVRVTLSSRSSAFARTVDTDNAGEFSFRAVAIGEYLIAVEASGFAKSTTAVTVLSDRATVVAVQLRIVPVSQQVTVTSSPGRVDSNAATPVTLINREQIATAPGADRTNSLAMITNFVPGSYVTHNQLHLRGGHQVTWLVDGIAVPNTNIADTV